MVFIRDLMLKGEAMKKDKNNRKVMFTCRHHCDLFDEITNKCSIRFSVDMDNPITVASCEYFLLKKHSHLELVESRINLDCSIDLTTNQFSLYPLVPDELNYRDDAIWYISPCATYGCWIIKHYKKKFMIVNSSFLNHVDLISRKYKSTHPLHDHAAPISLASKMAWYIDIEGYGSYVLLKQGEIIPLHNNDI